MAGRGQSVGVHNPDTRQSGVAGINLELEYKGDFWYKDGLKGNLSEGH